MSYGGKIKLLRKLRGLTQSELAKELGVSKSIVFMWEHEERAPRDAMKKKIAKFFHMSVQAIFFED